MWNQIDWETFLEQLKEHMQKSGRLKPSSIRAYLRRIRCFLEKGYSVADLCGAIERLIGDYSRNGSQYDQKDHGNTKSALNHVKWMIKHPYIHYKKGWESFPNQEEHCVEYCIDGNTISVSKAVGFTTSRKETKQISANDMTTLIAILDEAKKNSLFEVSNTCIHTGHGVYCSYDYSYCGQSGMECRGLFIDACKADVLQDRYNNLIETLLK